MDTLSEIGNVRATCVGEGESRAVHYSYRNFLLNYFLQFFSVLGIFDHVDSKQIRRLFRSCLMLASLTNGKLKCNSNSCINFKS